MDTSEGDDMDNMLTTESATDIVEPARPPVLILSPTECATPVENPSFSSFASDLNNEVDSDQSYETLCAISARRVNRRSRLISESCEKPSPSFFLTAEHLTPSTSQS